MGSAVYDSNAIQTLSFRQAIRERVAMYMGSADNQGVLQCIREIITNSIDEATMGFGDTITVIIDSKDKGVRGVLEHGVQVCRRGVDMRDRPCKGSNAHHALHAAGGGALAQGRPCEHQVLFQPRPYRQRAPARHPHRNGAGDARRKARQDAGRSQIKSIIKERI